jgi:hypothetical protein
VDAGGRLVVRTPRRVEVHDAEGFLAGRTPLAIVFGVVAVPFLPVVLGVIGLVPAIVARTVRHEGLSTVAIVVSAVGLVAGVILGAIAVSM